MPYALLTCFFVTLLYFLLFFERNKWIWRCRPIRFGCQYSVLLARGQHGAALPLKWFGKRSSENPFFYRRKSVSRLSSVTFVQPTQRVKLFRNIFAPSNSLWTSIVCVKILERNSRVLGDRVFKFNGKVGVF